MSKKIQRPISEVEFSEELKRLKKSDPHAKPGNWKLSPKRVVDFIVGTELEDGTVISPKYIGNRSLIELAVATLTTERALLLSGVPGTAKTWVSELLAASISGNSRLLVQGTAGTHEEKLLYGWNYPVLLSKGPVREALVPSPVMKGMESGSIVRIEEFTRMPFEIQDALITVLSERSMPIPELGVECKAIRGFNVIATANDRDKGIHEMSSALKRRFNTVVLPLPETIEEELKIVTQRISPQLQGHLKELMTKDNLNEIRKIITIFKELREGQTTDGKIPLKKVSSTLSTAEIIGVVDNALSMAVYFNDGELTGRQLASGIAGVVVSNKDTDEIPWREYLEVVMKKREDYDDFYSQLNNSTGEEK